MTKKALSEAKAKELETRARLGPRLPRPESLRNRVYGDAVRSSTFRPRRNRLPLDSD